MKNEKYIVFKREEYEFSRTIGIKPIAVEDAVVIRTQDIFAAGGLRAYAVQIDLAMQMIPGDQGRLPEIRDYFEAVAQEAEDRKARGEARLPD